MDQYYDIPSLTPDDVTKKYADTTTPAINYAKTLGIVDRNAECFAPKRNITTLEAVVVLLNLHKIFGICSKDNNYQNYELTKNYPNWAKESMQYVLYNIYVSGEALDTVIFDKKYLDGFFLSKSLQFQVLNR